MLSWDLNLLNIDGPDAGTFNFGDCLVIIASVSLDGEIVLLDESLVLKISSAFIGVTVLSKRMTYNSLLNNKLRWRM